MPTRLYVIKRNGRKEIVYFDKITARIKILCYGLNLEVIDPVTITMKVIEQLYSGVTTAELDNIAADIAETMSIEHPDYGKLAARIAISNLHKETKKVFSDIIEDLYNAKCEVTDERYPLISDHHYKIIKKHSDRLNSSIIYDRDFLLDYNAFKMLKASILLRINDKIIERPQHLLMRVAVGIHGDDIDSVIETYNLMAKKFFIHDIRTLIYACAPTPYLASSFSLDMSEDSIGGIFDTLERCARIGKFVGDVGLSIHCIRAQGSPISGSNGCSNGLVPMLRVYNNMARYVFQDGVQNNHNVAIYLEPWHADIFEYLSLPKSQGKGELRCRNLRFGLWIPDLFMKRVEKQEMWSLMCSFDCPGLDEVWGDDFEKLYVKFENEKKYRKQIPAEKLWRAIVEAQVETGMPYLLYKDHCNRKSNQMNLGTIKSSSFHSDVIQYSSKNEIGVCCLASIAVNIFVDNTNKGLSFDFVQLKAVVKTVTKNLNKIIDLNQYPFPEAEIYNKRHRPIGIGIQGLADTFATMKYAYDSEQATLLNQQIFETLYYGALEASCELAEKFGPYETFTGSPVSKGILQYEMWNKTPTNLWDWEKLKGQIKKYGVRNSLLIAVGHDEISAQILGNNVSFEPFSTNVSFRRVLSKELPNFNKYLVMELMKLNLWNKDIQDSIISHNGSIQQIDQIPMNIKQLYRTVWEISKKPIINMAADRGAFIDQSQSLNLHLDLPTYAKMSSMHFYGWKCGLKTGMYHLNTQLVDHSSPVQSEKIKETEENDVSDEALMCSLLNKEACIMCTS